ncbi:MAG: cytochrome C [Deltaproteobacteria bacterium]|nr:MAG: cytochrome C [Deltaproteobacteria bacterium]
MSEVFFLALLLSAMLVGNVFAVPSGKTIEYAGGSAGKVILDGKTHAEKGLKCGDCHPKLFPMKKGEGFKMADINAGKACGACHNGEKAFKANDNANCGKCHQK